MERYVASHWLGAVWVGLCVLTAVVEATGLFRSRVGAAQRDRGSGLVLRLLLVPAIILLVLSPELAPGAEVRPELVSLVVGVAVFTAGETLRIWARATLGRYFTYAVETSADQPVIENGPYRFVRHPSYTGILLILVGFGFVWGNWVGIAVVAALTMIGLAYRIKVEEVALLEDLGADYAAYASRHKRLVPLVW